MNVKSLISIALIAGGFTFTACQSSKTEKKSELNENFTEENLAITTMKYDTIFHDFGTINQDEKVDFTYIFTNTGENELMLKSVKASCGCTVPEWTKEPVAPGQKGQIKVIFNSSGRKGLQRKTITVVANTEPNTTFLKFNAEVQISEEKK